MTEDRVGFLFNLASTLSTCNPILKLLKSHYLMRCVELTNGMGLPAKQFSTKARCRYCCLEWSKCTGVNVQHKKLNRRQRQKMQLKNKNNEKKTLLHSKEMEQICTFCKQVTITEIMKPKNEYIKGTPPNSKENKLIINNQKQKTKKASKYQQKAPEIKKTGQNNKNSEIKAINRSAAVNVYSNASDVFSLKNEKNTLKSAIKEPARVIKNNKKKKDKFAGLCQKAVLASAKLKQQKATEIQKPISQNKLSLFLKPSC